MTSKDYKFLKIASLFVMVCAIIYVAAFQSAPPIKPVLKIPEAQQTLEAAFEGQYIRHRFAIVNQSDQDIQDIELIASCSCTSVEPVRLGLKAGESRSVEIAIDTTGFLRRSQDFEDDFAVTLKAIGQQNGKTVGQRFPFTGRVKRWAVPSPGSIEFEGVNQIVQGDTGRAELSLRTEDDVQMSDVFK